MRSAGEVDLADGVWLRSAGWIVLWLLLVLVVGGLWGLSTMSSRCTSSATGIGFADGAVACARTVRVASGPVLFGMAVAGAASAVAIATATRMASRRRP